MKMKVNRVWLPLETLPPPVLANIPISIVWKTMRYFQMLSKTQHTLSVP